MQVTNSLWKLSESPTPLRRVAISGTIMNLSAELTFTHIYQTSMKQRGAKIDLKLPLYDLGIVTGFQCTVGKQVVPSTVELKSDVDKRYSSFNGANFQNFKDLHSTDIFVVHLEGVPPYSVIEVKITLVCNLFLSGEELALIIPTCLAPKVYQHELPPGTPSTSGGGFVKSFN